jgi:uncharacterized protein (TIGR00251 family)
MQEEPNNCYDTPAGQTLTLRVKVTPGASKTCLMGVKAGRLRVHIAAPPERGKANATLITFLAKTLGVPKNAIAITAGEKSRDKTLLLPADVLPALQAMVASAPS